MKKTPKTKSGFTLLEVLVAIGIFTIFLGVATSAYVGIVRGHSSENARRKMLSDSRYLMEQIEDALKEGTIDYFNTYCDKGKDLTTPSGNANQTDLSEFERQRKTCNSTKLGNGFTEKLVVVSKDGNNRTIIEFKPDENKVYLTKQTRTFLDLTNKELTDQNLFELSLKQYQNTDSRTQGPQELDLPNSFIKNLNFLVTPIDDPYAQRNYQYAAMQFQPQVTVFLEAGLPQENSNTNLEAPINIQTTISSRLYAPRQ